MGWAAQLFSTPIALISLVDEDYVHFKALTGAEGVPGLARTESMCSAAILVDAPIITSDYKAESCALIKPDVAQALGLNFYAGAALQMPDGARIGMMAVIGRENRTLSGAEEDVLQRLAALVSRTIELRFRYLHAHRPNNWEDAQQELAATLDDNAALTRYLTHPQRRPQPRRRRNPGPRATPPGRRSQSAGPPDGRRAQGGVGEKADL